MTRTLIIAALFGGLSLLSSVQVLAATLYVSPSGSSSGTGTISAPFNSIQAGIDAATAGSTIYLRGGTYSPTTNIQIKKSGAAGQPYVLSAYSGEKVVIDGEALP